MGNGDPPPDFKSARLANSTGRDARFERTRFRLAGRHRHDVRQPRQNRYFDIDLAVDDVDVGGEAIPAILSGFGIMAAEKIRQIVVIPPETDAEAKPEPKPEDKQADAETRIKRLRKWMGKLAATGWKVVVEVLLDKVLPPGRGA